MSINRHSSDSDILKKKKKVEKLRNKEAKKAVAVLRRHSLDLSPGSVFSALNTPRCGLGVLMNYQGIL